MRAEAGKGVHVPEASDCWALKQGAGRQEAVVAVEAQGQKPRPPAALLLLLVVEVKMEVEALGAS
jgi:hypothetical protein